jgi:hypothetical protein
MFSFDIQLKLPNKKRYNNKKKKKSMDEKDAMLAKIYRQQYERQLLSAKAEQQYIDELLTLGLIRKMLERERQDSI